MEVETTMFKARYTLCNIKICNLADFKQRESGQIYNEKIAN